MTIMLLLVTAGVHLFSANAIGAFTAVTFVFFLARSEVFKNAPAHSLRRAITLYWIWQVVAITAASGLIVVVKLILTMLMAGWLDAYLFVADPLAKIMITPATLVANYLFMKWLFESSLVRDYAH